MKVGNIIGGLEVVDVKFINKLNLIQFLKEVEGYLQNGYQIDVKSGRQVGLALQCKMFKTEAASNIDFGSTDVNSTDVSSTESQVNADVISTGEQIPTESVGVTSKEVESVPEGTSVPEESIVTESTVQQEQVTGEAVVEPVVDTVKEEAPVVPKKTTTRSKKSAQ